MYADFLYHNYQNCAEVRTRCTWLICKSLNGLVSVECLEYSSVHPHVRREPKMMRSKHVEESFRCFRSFGLRCDVHNGRHVLPLTVEFAAKIFTPGKSEIDVGYVGRW